MAEERAAFLMTECNQERFSFAVHFSRRVEAGFTAGQVSSDGGALLLREVVGRQKGGWLAKDLRAWLGRRRGLRVRG